MTELNVIAILGLLCCVQSITGIPYELFVYTGDVFGAGTDAKVFVTLYGENGQSKEKELDSKNKNDFERNHIDTYKLDLKDLGKLKKITIRHDNSWFGSGWFLEKVLIQDKNGCTYDFPCHNWLASNWGDKKISRDLITKTKCDLGSKKNLVCTRGLGMSSGLIKDRQITASSSYDDKHQPFHARLKKTVKGSKGAWCSAFADDTEFLQIDFNETTQVGSIATQGQAMFNNWVTKYSLSYSSNGATWTSLKENGKEKIFKGNKDRDSIVTHRFKTLKAKAIRIHPLAWEGLTNCMRVELYGCDKEDLPHNIDKRLRKEKLQKKKIILQAQQNISGLTILDKAVLYLRFDTITNSNTILDQSDLHNDARIVNFARLSRFSEKCGRGVDLNGGDVLLNGEHFINKPHTAVTIATWVKFFNNEGYNSVFDTIGGDNSTHSMGQYHLEVINGSVRWFHRNEKKKIIFNVLTEVIVPAHIWTHIACTYDSSTRYAEVFVNAKFVMREEGSGLLSQDWQVKAGIGEHKGERLLDGVIDEFYISNWALAQEEIKKLMKICEFEKECFSPIGMEDLKIKDDQITASSVLQPHKPYYARLNLISFYDDVKRSAWCSDDDDKDPYLTIDLKTEKTISGVAVQGASVFDSFVTSYKLCYSHSGRKYDCVKDNVTGETLMGSEDKDNIKIHWLTKLFDARFVRFYPLSWYGENICMRVELYGCITGLLSDTVEERLKVEIDPLEPDTADCSVSCGKGTVKTVHHCNDAVQHPKCKPGKKTYEERTECIQPSCPECFISMGTSNGSPEEPLVSSTPSYDSVHAENNKHVIASSRGEIVPGGSWCARTADTRQYLEVDLNKPIKVTGIGTQGQGSDDQWVSKYHLSYTINGLVWNNYTEDSRLKVFTGNDDKDTISIRHLKHPVTARYIRVHPLTWHGRLICMRAEIFGCDHSSNVVHRQLLLAKNTLKTKNSESRQLHNVTHAKPTHQVNTLKKDASDHLKNLAYTNGVYRNLAGIHRDSKVVPTKKTTSKKINTYAHTKTGRKSVTRIIQLPKKGTARKISVSSAAARTGTPRFTMLVPHVRTQVTNLMRNRVFPSRVTNNGASGFYLVGHNRDDLSHYVPNKFYMSQGGIPNRRYGIGFAPKIQAFHSLMEYPSRLVTNKQRARKLEILPVSSLKTNSKRIKTQEPLRVTYVPKTVLNQRYMSRPVETGISRSYTPLYNGRTNIIGSNVNTAGNFKLYSPNSARNPYLLSRLKGIQKPSLLVLKNPQRHNNVLAKSYSMKPNLFIPQRLNSTPNSISLTLKEKFRDSVFHHFLEERLSKQTSKEEKAEKNEKVDAYLEYNWSSFGPCSVSCGRGVKERYRRCNAMECLADGSEIQILPCFNPPCKVSTEWSTYSRCSVSCGTGIRTRTRQCNGVECPRTGKEVSTIPCKNPACPVLNLDFEAIDGHVIIDQSGKGNNAFMEKETRVVPYKSLCGHHLDLGYHGNLLLEDLTFRKKPKYGVSIACWVNLQGTTRGSHSIFSTSKMVNNGQIIGGYHFEVDDGKVRWFHRSPSHNPVFSVVTNDVVRPNTWYHVVGTYSSTSSKAKVFIDGKLQGSASGNGLLDDDWGYRASIGSFDFDGRYIRAKLDDFFMYDYEISPEQIQDLLSIKCPNKKHKKYF